jgi:hypothetical protein
MPYSGEQHDTDTTRESNWRRGGRRWRGHRRRRSHEIYVRVRERERGWTEVVFRSTMKIGYLSIFFKAYPKTISDNTENKQ